MDYKLGDGAEARTGDTVSVHYRGTLKDGTEFDSSLSRPRPLVFPLGQGRVIKGWDVGIAGMKVGGLRKLIIPAELAYGDRARGKIPANADLTFTVELMAVKPATTPPGAAVGPDGKPLPGAPAGTQTPTGTTPDGKAATPAKPDGKATAPAKTETKTEVKTETKTEVKAEAKTPATPDEAKKAG
ncbi:MAG: FKBP-type peptidyl-prolyl cis-trans isomerase [Myxococcales bacterium]|nr:FKBP-type peptidyl-prolyl cis-trans isomerase [Myxococcales bacterium]